MNQDKYRIEYRVLFCKNIKDLTQINTRNVTVGLEYVYYIYLFICITNIQPTSEPDEKLPIQRCRWTFQEDQLLLQLVRTHCLTCYKTLAKHMEGKKPAQVYFKLRHLKQLYETHKDDTRVYNMNKKWFQYFKSCNC
ncbi:SANT/Myb_domain [Hexamita inflata]|uniref:SANT/Myb domain n=1 Tax=Hexamita inflata TaxID=28002 RepID=A0AA86UTI9_9EUKA|nr:SANT/Myb domain [Hexamita inflata]